MANRYANLVGSNKIKDEWQKINQGFDAVQADIDAKPDASFAQVNDIAASADDTLTIEGGTGIEVTTIPAEKKVRIVATGTSTPGPHAIEHITGGTDVIPDATTSSSGLMSAADKAALENMKNMKLINVKDYGAKGDGITDDTEAIQAAIDAAELAGGAIVYINDEHVVSPRVQVDATNAPNYYAALEVPDNTIIVSGPKGKLKHVSAPGETRLMRYMITNKDRVHGNANWGVYGLEIDCGRAENANATVVVGIGVYIASTTPGDGCKNVKIYRNKIYNCVLGIGSYNYNKNSAKHSNIECLFNTVEDATNKAIEFDSTEYSKIGFNRVRNCVDGLQFIYYSNHNVMIGNVVEGVTVTGINITHGSSYNTVAANQVVGNVPLIFRSEPVSDDNTIESNLVIGNTFKALVSGTETTVMTFNVKDTSYTRFKKNVIRDNMFIGAIAKIQIEDNGDSTLNWEFSGNAFIGNVFDLTQRFQFGGNGGTVTSRQTNTIFRNNIILGHRNPSQVDVWFSTKIDGLVFDGNELRDLRFGIDVLANCDFTNVYVDGNSFINCVRAVEYAVSGTNYSQTGGGLKSFRRNRIKGSTDSTIVIEIRNADGCIIEENDVDGIAGPGGNAIVLAGDNVPSIYFARNNTIQNSTNGFNVGDGGTLISRQNMFINVTNRIVTTGTGTANTLAADTFTGGAIQ